MGAGPRPAPAIIPVDDARPAARERAAGEAGDEDAGARRLTTEVVTSEAGLLALRAEWSELLQASRANTLFLTWEWISVWWRVYGTHELHVVLVRNSRGVLVGMAPLHLVRRTAFGATWLAAAFLGNGGDVTPEGLDFVIRDGWGDDVAGAMLDVLLSSPGIAEIDLQPLAAPSRTLALAMSTMKLAGGVTTRSPGSRRPYATLPASREEFLASRSKNYRKKIGEYQRRCQRKFAPRLRRSETPAEVTRDLGTLRRLHSARWGNTSLSFQSAEYIEFHEQFAQLMLRQGGLRLYSLEASDGRPLAMSYCVNHAGRCYYYQAGRDPLTESERTGLVLMHHVILEAITDGVSVFDFLSGQEKYKYRWANGETGSDRVTHWRHASTYALAMGHRVVSALRSLPHRVDRRLGREQ